MIKQDEMIKRGKWEIWSIFHFVQKGKREMEESIVYLICIYIYIIYMYICFFCFCCLDNTDVLLDARCKAITVFVVTLDDSFYFAAVVCVVENLVESGVV